MVAGWGDGIPGVQLNSMCGSGQEAVNIASAKVGAGQHDVMIAGGVEHMTRVPMYSNFGELSDTYYEKFPECVKQGESAERIAEKWDFTLEELNQIAAESQQRYNEALESGRYDAEITPVRTELAGEQIVVEENGHPRPETTVESISDLPLAFLDEGNSVIHAGNSSGNVDGSSAVLVANEETARDPGWEPKARVIATEEVGVDPVLKLTRPIPATEQVLDKADLSMDDIDLFEVNEAFASVILTWLEETGAPWEKTNFNGGAIAHRHPLGETGGALMGKIVHEQERTADQYALCTMCIGIGQGIAAIIERV
jgi:acetyl-CoA C-acetyltransferase